MKVPHKDREKNRPELKIILREAFALCKKHLRDCIQTSKKDIWERVCNDVDRNVWDKGYGIVKKRLGGNTPKPQLTMEFTEDVVTHLFTPHEPVKFSRFDPIDFRNFTEEELKTVSNKLKERNLQVQGVFHPKWLKKLQNSNQIYAPNVQCSGIQT